jgi:hypothetical protein
VTLCYSYYLGVFGRFGNSVDGFNSDFWGGLSYCVSFVIRSAVILLGGYFCVIINLLFIRLFGFVCSRCRCHTNPESFWGWDGVIGCIGINVLLLCNVRLWVD